MSPKPPTYKPISALWKKASVPLPIKGNAEAEAYNVLMQKEWEAVRELEKRPFGGRFKIGNMHYGDIPAPKKT